MNKREFQAWMTDTGYSNINDWNMQEIEGYLHDISENELEKLNG